jgi:hypothetical protein
MPVIGFVNSGSADPSAGLVAAFRKGLGETGYVDGRNVTVEYHWLDGQYDRLAALMAEVRAHRVLLARRQASDLQSDGELWRGGRFVVVRGSAFTGNLDRGKLSTR